MSRTTLRTSVIADEPVAPTPASAAPETTPSSSRTVAPASVKIPFVVLEAADGVVSRMTTPFADTFASSNASIPARWFFSRTASATVTSAPSATA